MTQAGCAVLPEEDGGPVDLHSECPEAAERVGCRRPRTARVGRICQPSGPGQGRGCGAGRGLLQAAAPAWDGYFTPSAPCPIQCFKTPGNDKETKCTLSSSPPSVAGVLMSEVSTSLLCVHRNSPTGPPATLSVMTSATFQRRSSGPLPVRAALPFLQQVFVA